MDRHISGIVAMNVTEFRISNSKILFLVFFCFLKHSFKLLAPIWNAVTLYVLKFCEKKVKLISE